METLTITSRNQLVIPRSIRELLRLRPGQKLHAMVHDNRIELIPVRKARALRGFVKGINTSVARERDRT